MIINLSPYEKDRIVPQAFGQTEMGRDLLAQDYILKQITASLIYPESQLGKEFWTKVYAQAQAKYGTTNIPINTFNKVWIVPDKAVVYENGGTAFVLENHLKVMLEQDYLSLQKHKNNNVILNDVKDRNKINFIKDSSATPQNDVNALGSQVLRQIIIPALIKEVNEGKNFAPLRQVFYSLILATWYKKKIKDSILNKIYSDRNKVNGVQYDKSVISTSTVILSAEKDLNKINFLRDSSPSAQNDDIERIYQRYLQAFKKGVYNYIKEDPLSSPNAFGPQDRIPIKYFSGGVEADLTSAAMRVLGAADKDKAMSQLKDSAMVEIDTRVQPTEVSQAILAINKRNNSRAMIGVKEKLDALLQEPFDNHAGICEQLSLGIGQDLRAWRKEVIGLIKTYSDLDQVFLISRLAIFIPDKFTVKPYSNLLFMIPMLVSSLNSNNPRGEDFRFLLEVRGLSEAIINEPASKSEKAKTLVQALTEILVKRFKDAFNGNVITPDWRDEANRILRKFDQTKTLNRDELDTLDKLLIGRVLTEQQKKLSNGYLKPIQEFILLKKGKYFSLPEIKDQVPNVPGEEIERILAQMVAEGQLRASRDVRQRARWQARKLKNVQIPSAAMMVLKPEDRPVVDEIYQRTKGMSKDAIWSDFSFLNSLLFVFTTYPDRDVFEGFNLMTRSVKSMDDLIQQVEKLDTSRENRKEYFLANLKKVITGEIKLVNPTSNIFNFWPLLNAKDADDKLKEWDIVRKTYLEIRPQLIGLIDQYQIKNEKRGFLDNVYNKVKFAGSQMSYWCFLKGDKELGESDFMHPIEGLMNELDIFYSDYQIKGMESVSSKQYLAIGKSFKAALDYINLYINLSEKEVREKNIGAQEILGLVTRHEFEKEGIGQIYGTMYLLLLGGGYVNQNHQVDEKLYQLTDDFMEAHTHDYSPDQFTKVNIILDRLHLPKIFARFKKIDEEMTEARTIPDPIKRKEVLDQLSYKKKLLIKNSRMPLFVSHEDWFDAAFSHRLGILYQELSEYEIEWQNQINVLMKEKELSVEQIEKEESRPFIEGASMGLIDGKELWKAPDGHLIQSNQRPVPSFKEYKDLISKHPRNSKFENMSDEEFARYIQQAALGKKSEFQYYNPSETRLTTVQHLIDNGDFKISKDLLLNDVLVEILWRAGIKPNAAMNVDLQKTTGGINLDPAQMNMQVKKEGGGFTFDFNGAKIDAAQVIGATFTIDAIRPVTDLVQVLGVDPRQMRSGMT